MTDSKQKKNRRTVQKIDYKWQTNLKMIQFQKFCSTFCQFLDTQVSLEPTPVLWLVGPLVGWSVSWSHFRISNLRSEMVAQIKKIQKTKFIYF